MIDADDIVRRYNIIVYGEISLPELPGPRDNARAGPCNACLCYVTFVRVCVYRILPLFTILSYARRVLLRATGTLYMYNIISILLSYYYIKSRRGRTTWVNRRCRRTGSVRVTIASKSTTQSAPPPPYRRRGWRGCRSVCTPRRVI